MCIDFQGLELVKIVLSIKPLSSTKNCDLHEANKYFYTRLENGPLNELEKVTGIITISDC